MWGAHDITHPTLKSLQAISSLTTLVLVFHVGSVFDEIMRAVVDALEDLEGKHLSTVSFFFKPLVANNKSINTTTLLSIVLKKMKHMFPGMSVKTDWLRK